MIKFWQERVKNPISTKNLECDSKLKEIKKELKSVIGKKFAGSLAIRMVSSGSCNACEAECNALSNPYYNLERLCMHFVASPRHADIILLSGVVSANMYHHILNVYQQMPQPAYIVTLGDCPLLQGVFQENFAIKGAKSLGLPIAYHINGCPPNPQEIITGLLEFLKSLG
ncbi:MAG: hydrogenase [Epsilonproteobacteria bacterium]|nr:hydrogenase [Campylobacterota bacterium]